LRRRKEEGKNENGGKGRKERKVKEEKGRVIPRTKILATPPRTYRHADGDISHPCRRQSNELNKLTRRRKLKELSHFPDSL